MYDARRTDVVMDTQTWRIEKATALMLRFAGRTGLEPDGRQHRYLWTDAFAVSNFLGLARATGESRFQTLALRLADLVHQVLGRHRPDDGRVGWISGLGEAEGAAHPTRGGLRIGKKLPERREDQPFDDELEWERDGQYFHYLTRWCHALNQLARATGTGTFVTWARELGQAGHDGFIVPLGQRGNHRLYWKMSIDLSRPLVRSTSKLDAVDGYVMCLETEASAARVGGAQGPALDALATDFAELIDPEGLASADPLSVGGLLMDAHRLERLRAEGGVVGGVLVEALLTAALAGLESYEQHGGLEEVGEEHRLAFREAGLAIGLEAAARMRATAPLIGGASDRVRRNLLLRELARHQELASEILAFWLEGDRVRAGEHQDIDEVMLAAALLPSGCLDL